MRNSKTIAAVMVALFVLSAAMLIQTSSAVTVNTSDTTAKEKLPAFLSDVIGLDLAKYNRTNEGYSVSYPSKFGGLVKEESLSFTLDSNDYKITVGSVFDNGFPSWISVRVLNGSLTYATQPSTDALVESRNIIQRYHFFAQNYNISTVDLTSTLNLLSSVPDSPPINGDSTNFNRMSDLTPGNATSEDMKLQVSETSIGFWYTTNDIDVKNKYFGLSFGYNTFIFSDVWNLYSIGCFSVLSEEEATNMAFEVANDYCLNQTWYQTDKNNVITEVKPDWSQMRSDVGFNMIPSQTYNNSLNDALLAKGVGVNSGNTTRNPLALYPFWSMVFFFSEPIGNIAGIQVGLWGDTKEIAYCMEYGYLGNSGQTSTGDTEQTPTSTLDNSGQASNTQASFLSTEIITCIVLAAIVAIVTTTVFWKKKHR